MNFKSILIISLASFLVACSQSYSISEEKINSAANKKVSEYQSKKPLVFSYKKSKVNIDIKNINIDLQENSGGFIALTPDVNVTAELNILGRSLSKTVSAKPTFVSKLTYEDGSFYLKDPQFLKDSVKPRNTIEEKAYESLGKMTSYIKEIPIYNLDHNLKEKIGAEIIDRMIIGDTQITFEI